MKFKFLHQKSMTFFFVTFTILLLDSGVCLPLNKVNELNLKKNLNSYRKKSNFKLNNF